jgi:hypothetical protein
MEMYRKVAEANKTWKELTKAVDAYRIRKAAEGK